MDTDMESFPVYMGDEKMDEWYPPAEFPMLKRKLKDDREWVWHFSDKVLLPLRKEHPEIFGQGVVHKGKLVLSFDNYMWAASMVESRRWGSSFEDYPGGLIVRGRKNGQLSHIAPVADMMNKGIKGECLTCDATYNSIGRDRGQEGHLTLTNDQVSFVCRTWSPIKKGEEILYFYNDDCKQSFVKTYGFTTPEQSDCVEFGAGFWGKGGEKGRPFIREPSPNVINIVVIMQFPAFSRIVTDNLSWPDAVRTTNEDPDQHRKRIFEYLLSLGGPEGKALRDFYSEQLELDRLHRLNQKTQKTQSKMTKNGWKVSHAVTYHLEQTHTSPFSRII